MNWFLNVIVLCCCLPAWPYTTDWSYVGDCNLKWEPWFYVFMFAWSMKCLERQYSEKSVILSRCALHTYKRFDPFHIPEVETLVIYPVLLLSCHSCLYDSSALNAWMDKLYAILFRFVWRTVIVCNNLSSVFLRQGCPTVRGELM